LGEGPVSNPQPSTLNPQQLLFHRLPGETPRAFGAFLVWFQLGQSRSHQAVADKLSENPATVRNWASKYDWSDRLVAFTSGLLQQQAADVAERQRKQAADWAARLDRFREQEWDAAQKLLSAAQCFLETFGDDHLQNMTLSQVSRALSISSQIGRSALAGAELPLSSEPAMAPIQQQMLEALKRLSGRASGPANQPSRPGTVAELASRSAVAQPAVSLSSFEGAADEAPVKYKSLNGRGEEALVSDFLNPTAVAPPASRATPSATQQP